MNPRRKEALLWGVVGFLTFLVLLQGYELVQDVRVDLVVKAGAAVVVFLASTVITYVAGGRVATPAEGTDETVAEDATTGGIAGDDGTPASDDTPGDGTADENRGTMADDGPAEEDDEGTHSGDADTRDETEQ